MIEPQVIKLNNETSANTYFRRVLFTGKDSQLVLMSLEPGEEIGTEVHEVDQLVYIVRGQGRAVLDGIGETIERGSMVCVPAGVQHNIVNSTLEPMKLFTIYGPPEHAPGTLQKANVETRAWASVGEHALRPGEGRGKVDIPR